MTPPARGDDARGATPGSQQTGRLLVLSGPSGVGKSAVADRLVQLGRFGRAITATTRKARPGEKDGVDYYFLAAEEFRRRIAARWFLEHAEVYGRLYGTPRSSVEAVVATGRHCVLVIDVQGAETLRAARTDATFVFLEPPTFDELRRRLTARGGDEPESVKRRIDEAARELEHAPHFHHRVVNHDLEATALAVARTVEVENR